MASALTPVAFALAVNAMGCAGVYDGQVYHRGSVSFRVNAPAGQWRRVELSDAALTWVTEAATLQVSGSCAQSHDIPLAALRNHYLIGFTAREIQSEEVFQLAGREALRTRVRAALDGVATDLDIVTTKKNGCAYAFVLSQRGVGTIAAARDFEALVASFEVAQ